MQDAHGRTVTVIDFSMGNLFSVARALMHCGACVKVSRDPKDVHKADRVVLPGVGAFGAAAQRLASTGLGDAVREVIRKERPFLGICLGLQLLFEVSEEFGEHQGLGVFKGRVRRLESRFDTSGWRLKVPHIGWNRVFQKTSGNGSGVAPVLKNIEDGAFFYFVHAYYVDPSEPRHTAAVTTYGPTTFCSAYARGPVAGCQFHPERSGPDGLSMYRNFLSL